QLCHFQSKRLHISLKKKALLLLEVKLFTHLDYIIGYAIAAEDPQYLFSTLETHLYTSVGNTILSRKLSCWTFSRKNSNYILLFFLILQEYSRLLQSNFLIH